MLLKFIYSNLKIIQFRLRNLNVEQFFKYAYIFVHFKIILNIRIYFKLKWANLKFKGNLQHTLFFVALLIYILIWYIVTTYIFFIL